MSWEPIILSVLVIAILGVFLLPTILHKPKSDEFVNLACFSDEGSLQKAKGILEKDGISCVVSRHHVGATLKPFGDGASYPGPRYLRVEARNQLRATELLRQDPVLRVGLVS